MCWVVAWTTYVANWTVLCELRKATVWQTVCSAWRSVWSDIWVFKLWSDRTVFWECADACWVNRRLYHCLRSGTIFDIVCAWWKSWKILWSKCLIALRFPSSEACNKCCILCALRKGLSRYGEIVERETCVRLGENEHALTHTYTYRVKSTPNLLSTAFFPSITLFATVVTPCFIWFSPW